MKKYNKPSLELSPYINESIANLDFNANYLSIGNEGGTYIAPEAEDIW